LPGAPGYSAAFATSACTPQTRRTSQTVCVVRKASSALISSADA
jgi:hypothetical protein